ncbi:DNA polymerase III subunit beta [Larkinella harenae]
MTTTETTIDTSVLVIISSRVLSNVLTELKAVKARNPVVPILDDIFFIVGEADTVTISAMDLQNHLAITVAAMTDPADAGKKFLINFNYLNKVVKSLPEQPISLIIKNNQLQIEAQRGKYFVYNLNNPADYPKIPEPKEGELSIPGPGRSEKVGLSFNAQDLRRMLEIAIPFTTTDDLRPAMCGVYIGATENKLQVVATDGHRLTKLEGDYDGKPFGVIVPRKAGKLLASVIKSLTMCYIEFHKNVAVLDTGMKRLVFRLTDERYPDFNNAIPALNLSTARIERTELIYALTQATTFSDSGSMNQVLFTFSTDPLLIISSSNQHMGYQVEEYFEYEATGDLPTQMAFNGRFLLSTIKAIRSKYIQFDLIRSNSAAVVRPVEKSGEASENELYLTMPICI